ncbi:hypothetical protein HDU84_009551 [Entophlyctis sp. JEL0112]|nr:hypothetical protein HDU84_009551 [Entophlyctis sp. JEL0112]
MKLSFAVSNKIVKVFIWSDPNFAKSLSSLNLLVIVFSFGSSSIRNLAMAKDLPVVEVKAEEPVNPPNDLVILESNTQGLTEADYPDGGFDAWMVVVAGFWINFLGLGTLYCFGVYSNYYNKMNLDRLAVIQFIGSIATACLVSGGFVSGMLAEKFGMRLITGIGVIVMFLGLLLASFATSTWQFMLTQGFLFGIGSSLSYFSSLAAISQWWGKRRSIATGIAASGSGLGGLVLSPSVNALLSSVGLSWTLRIMALLILVVLLLLLPFVKQRIATTASKVPWDIMVDFRFLLLLGAVFFATAPNFIPAFIMPTYAEDVVGLTATDGATLLSIFNLASFLGRIAVGFAADIAIGKANSFIICTFLTSFSMLVIWPLCHSFGMLIFFALVVGFFSGAYFVLIPVIVGEMFGSARIGSLTGLAYVFSSIGYLGGPPVAGTIRDMYGYVPVCLFAGILTLVSALFCVAVRFTIERKFWKMA